MKTFIAASSGNIGSRIASHLLAAGHNTVLMTRRPGKSHPSATYASFDSTDAAALTAATRDVDTLFWLTPPAFAASSVKDFILTSAEAAATAIRTNQIRHVVNLTALSDNTTPDTVLAWVREAESILSSVAPNIIHLRPTWFMDNLLHQPKDALYTLFPADFSFPWIATADIGDVAAQYLLHPTWQGHLTRPLIGPAHHTITEVANLLNRPHHQITADQQRQTLAQLGATPDAVESYTRLFIDLARPDGPLSISRWPAAATPTTLKQFSLDKGLL